MRWLNLVILISCAKISLSQELFTDSLLREYYLSEKVVIDSCSYFQLYDAICPWIETPYKYGSSDRNGTDCSGFTKNIFKDVYGINLMGGSRHIFTQCTPVKKSDLIEGDLVFFKINPNRISHIGIYLGNNKFVHASTRLGVIISDLNEAYYTKYFYSGGRVASPALE